MRNKVQFYAPIILALIAVAAIKAAIGQTAASTAITLTWMAPTTNTDGSAIAGPITYNIYSGATKTGTMAKVVSGLTATQNLAANPTQPCYSVTAVVNGLESAQSGVVCVTGGVVVSNPNPPGQVQCKFTVTPTGATTATITATCQ